MRLARAADHEKFAAHFGCERVLHEDDVTAGTSAVERKVAGTAVHVIDDGFRVIPVPGHTKGSACLLFQNRFLFTGDHLAWSSSMGQLYAFQSGH